FPVRPVPKPGVTVRRYVHEARDLVVGEPHGGVVHAAEVEAQPVEVDLAEGLHPEAVPVEGDTAVVLDQLTDLGDVAGPEVDVEHLLEGRRVEVPGTEVELQGTALG